MFKKILIATDGSPTATKAAERGAEVASDVGAAVVFLYVGESEDGADILRQAQSSLGDGLASSTTTMAGDPADVICTVAELEGADLVVVGNKGIAGSKRFLLGNVPDQVSHHAPCSVLIVKTT